MDNADLAGLLAKLGAAVDAELESWNAHLKDFKKRPTYEALLSDESTTPKKKVSALIHLLETLPARYTALVLSYGDPKLETVNLSHECYELLSELHDPNSDVDLETWFNSILTSKRFTPKVAALEKDIKDAENGRLQALRMLKANQMSLAMVQKDGELDGNELVTLLEAMEAVGVNLMGQGLYEDSEEEKEQQ